MRGGTTLWRLMRESPVGRILVASLHQAISDITPQRVGFYEVWLSSEGLRAGSIGLAPLYAVLSFLRQEGEAYETITSRAGEYAADWLVESMGPFTRGAIRAAFPWLRARLLLRLADRLVRASYRESRAVARVRKGTARIDLRTSIFCTVREPVNHPLCGFYAAAFTRLLTLFGLPRPARVVACRGTGEPGCVLTIVLTAVAPTRVESEVA